MSIRPVEMQGQIPRTQDIGKIQEQLQQRGQIGQDMIADEQKKQLEQKRKQVLTAKESGKSNFDKDKNTKDEQQSQQSKKENETKDNIDGKHPYKGKFIDFSG